MDDIKLIEPTLQHQEKAIEFIQEFIQFNSKINGVGGLDRYLEDYESWLLKIKSDSDGSIVDDKRVPANTYFALRKSDNRIIGMINLRHYLNEHFLKQSGHIGYGVRPTERRKGYATKILSLGLLKAKELKIDRVLVTCDKENIGSAKTIIKNGGILENEITDSDYADVVQRYWIMNRSE